MLSRLQESEEAARGNAGRLVVHQGMEIEVRLVEKPFGDGHSDQTLVVVDDGEWRNRPRTNTEVAAQPVRTGKREAPGPQRSGETDEIDAVILRHDDEPQPAPFAAEKQALAVAAGDRRSETLRLIDGEDRRMGDGLVVDPEAVEERQQLPCGQWGSLRHDDLNLP